MFRKAFCVVLVFIFGLAVVRGECDIQYKCNDTIILEKNDSFVEDYCKHHRDSNMTGRCCVLNETVIGLDLRFCEVKRLNFSGSDFLNLLILDARDNDYEKFISRDLDGLLQLEDLYLPQHIRCPGGKEAWNSTSHAHNMTNCSLQKDPCVYLNISCTDNGLCIHTGPALAKCVCKPGHYGYKCLNEGTFPAAIFAPVVIVPAILLSITLWFVQGRDVYKQNLS